MNPDTRTPPLPAPLPYSSQAGRGEIPATAPAAPTVDDHDAPLMREDDFTFWLCGGMVGFFIIIMLLVSLMGGL